MRLFPLPFALAVLLSSTGFGLESDPPVRRVAILIGANLSPPGRPSLRYSYRDAQELADVLVTAGRFHADDVHVLLDPKPSTVLGVLDAQLASMAGSPGETLLLFYYSGHADDAALYPGGEPLSLQSLKERLDNPSATVRVGIVDACSGGGWTRAKGLQPDQPFAVNVPLALSSEGSALIASSSGLESAHESQELQGSFFTHHLVAGLRGAADRSGDGRVTLGEAFSYAQERTIRDSAAQAGAPQHPSFDIHLRGRQDLALTEINASPSVVRVEETEGPLQLIHLETGLVVLEIPSGKRQLSLAIPPGRYLVQRRFASQTFVREITVEAGKRVTVTEESLTLVGSDELAIKGFAPRPLTLETTVPKNQVELRLALGVQHGAVGPEAGFVASSGDFISYGYISWGITDRLQYTTPLIFAYRFGERGGTEWMPWAGAESFGYSSTEGFTYALEAGGSMRHWLTDDTSLNVDVGAGTGVSTTSTVYGPCSSGGECPSSQAIQVAGPVAWSGFIDVGFTKTFRNIVTLNLATSWAQPISSPLGGSPAAGWHGGTIGIGAVGTLGGRRRQLPLLQLHVLRRFSIDAYASVDFDFHGNVSDAYLGGITWTF